MNREQAFPNVVESRAKRETPKSVRPCDVTGQEECLHHLSDASGYPSLFLNPLMKRSRPVKIRAAALVLLLLLGVTFTIVHHPSESPGSLPDREKEYLQWSRWFGTDRFPPVETDQSLPGNEDKNPPSRASFSREEFAEGVARHTTGPAMDWIAVASSSRFADVYRQKILEAFQGEAPDEMMESKIDAAIRSLSVARSLTLVFDTSFETSSGSPFLTAGLRIEDLTANVISMVKTEDLP